MTITMRKHWLASWGIGCFILALSGCITAPDFEEPQEAPSEIRSVVNEAILPRFESGQSVGCIVGVVKDGQRYLFGYGSTKKTEGECPVANTLFEIGSVTKTFTGVLMGSMVDDGVVQMEGPVRLYLPQEVSIPSYNGREITLVDLATHSSGLPELPEEAKSEPGYTLLNPWANYDLDDLYSYISSCTLTRSPGATYEYSTLGIALLANALTSVAGVDYEALLSQRVIALMGLGDTRITLSDEQQKRRAQGYTTVLDFGGTPVLQWPMPPIDFNCLAGGGALKSSMENMLTYLETMMNPDGTDLHDAITLSTTPHFTLDESDWVGLGWFIHQCPGGDLLVWHNGQTYSFTSFVGYLKDSRIGVVILNNTDIPVDSEAIAILEGLSGQSVLNATE